MGSVTGLVNASANCVHIGAQAADLNLGAIDATGDPTITNTGTLNIDSTIVAQGGNALTLIAGADIVSVAGNVGLDTSNPSGPGGDLNLIAGVTFTPFNTTTIAMPASGNVVVIGPSATGGRIDLNTVSIGKIDTSGTGGIGGNIQMVAFAGTGNGAGTVQIDPTVTIKTTSTSLAAGSVTILAGADGAQAAVTSNPAILVGNINAQGASLTSGAVTFTNAQPSGKVTVASTGEIISGAFKSGKLVDGGITSSGITTGGGAISIATQGAVNLTGGTFQTDAIGQGLSAGNVTITGGNIAVGGGAEINANGSTGANSGGVANPGKPGAEGGDGGNGGAVSITATSGQLLFDAGVQTFRRQRRQWPERRICYFSCARQGRCRRSRR